ncbi:MAG: hypothetical protein K8S98_04285 [Planctomycetes bacterium]|nr:hypothetical protein [Planctomycetota bacterium]
MSPHQLQLNLQTPLEEEAPRRSIGRRLREEWPAWLALAVCVQVLALGLIPALAESARLSDEEETLYAREQSDLGRLEDLRVQLRAQNDPIYQEREKRLLRAPQSPLED